MFKNLQTDPKPAQILSSRPSQYLPAQSNSKSPNWGGNGREHSQSLQTLL